MKKWNKDISTRFATCLVALVFSFFAFFFMWLSAIEYISFKWVIAATVIFGVLGFIYPEKFPKLIENLWKGISGHRD
jgi:hypothetical protein